MRQAPQNRIFLARLFHETNTFAPGATQIEDFAILRGAELIATEGSGSTTGVAVSEADARDWQVIPSVDFSTSPGPMVDDLVVDRFLDALSQDLEIALQEGLDAIFLILHGAMVSASDPDVEGTVLRRISELCGACRIPVVAVLDLHANVSPAMAKHTSMLLSYRENPHTDSAETTSRLAGLLQHVLESGIDSKVAHISTGIVWPPTGTGSKDDPMRSVLQLARSLEKDGVLAVNVCPGFAQADTPHTGLVFTVVYDPLRVDDARLGVIAHRLRGEAIRLAPSGIPKEWGIDAAIDAGLAARQFPCLLVEPADNIGGGAPGDGTWTLRKLIQREVPNFGAIINDPNAVDALDQAAIGAIVSLDVGGNDSPLSGEPISISGTLIAKTDGQFDVEDPHSHIVGMRGFRIEMGPCALIDLNGSRILLTSRKTPPFDLGQWRSAGVDPSQFDFIVVKAAVAHRQAYDKIAKSSYTVNCPGPCTSDLNSLPYQHLTRPAYPLDPIESLTSYD